MNVLSIANAPESFIYTKAFFVELKNNTKIYLDIIVLLNPINFCLPSLLIKNCRYIFILIQYVMVKIK